MEQAQKNLKIYALENSAMAQENFISDSLKLDEIRMEKRKVAEIADLLSIIENFIKSGNLDSKSYEALRASHPLVDDIQFRRILGMSETISAWAWPEVETIEAVSTTLASVKRLDVEIKNIEKMQRSMQQVQKIWQNTLVKPKLLKPLIEFSLNRSNPNLSAGFKPETFKCSHMQHRH